MAWYGVCTFGWTSNGSQSIGGTLDMAWYGHSLAISFMPHTNTMPQSNNHMAPRDVHICCTTFAIYRQSIGGTLGMAWHGMATH